KHGRVFPRVVGRNPSCPCLGIYWRIRSSSGQNILPRNMERDRSGSWRGYVDKIRERYRELILLAIPGPILKTDTHNESIDEFELGWPEPERVTFVEENYQALTRARLRHIGWKMD